jgi:protein SCO1/2
MIAQSERQDVSSAPAQASAGRRRRIVAAVGVAALVVAVTLGSWHRLRAHRLPSLTTPDDLQSLVDQEGKSFSFVHLKGRTVVMDFIFTHCPSSCPMQLRALIGIQRALPAALQSHVQFVSVSMDPARDTPAVLKAYAASLGADLGNWSFVTGADQEITWLHQYFHLRVKPIEGGLFDHRVIVYLLDATGRLIQKYSGDLDQARLIKEIGEVDSLFNKM